MADLEQRIADAERKAQEAKKRLQQLKAQKEAHEARKLQTLLKGQRAADTRRKILAGALMLELCERNNDTRTQFMAKLDAYLTRADDRALFDFAPPTSGQTTTD